MNGDIRLDVGFFDHPKTLALEIACGDMAPLNLVRLWCRVAVVRHKGNLDGLTPTKIERMAGWDGEAGAFYAALTDESHGMSPWIDDAGSNAARIHDWPEHQPYAFSADVRRENAKKGAAARWARDKQGPHARRNAGSNARRNAKRNAGGNADSNAERNAPAPAPTAGQAGAAALPAGEGAAFPPICSNCNQPTPVVTPTGGLCFACAQREAS